MNVRQMLVNNIRFVFISFKERYKIAIQMLNAAKEQLKVQILKQEQQQHCSCP